MNKLVKMGCLLFMLVRCCRYAHTKERYFALQMTLCMALIFGMASTQICCHAQSNAATYTQQVLKAPYTLVFSVFVYKPDLLLRSNTPLASYQSGTLTLSSNGKRFLYDAKFGKWSNIIICDTNSDTAYSYDNRYGNANIQPGANLGRASMRLLPMPGSGYDFYPMFQSFKYASTGPSHSTMAIIGGVTGGTSNYIEGMSYQDAVVYLNHGSHPATVSACMVTVPGRPALAVDIWKFSGYRMLGSVPIARNTDYVINTSTVDGQWPPRAMKQDGEIRYTLVTASTTALPDAQFGLESYLPSGCTVNDERQAP